MITKHITSLLEKEGFVFVNKLGKFCKKFHEASIENGTMTPPYNEVTFENDESGNGFALIMHIANHENIGIVAADEKINQWVAQIKEELNQTGEATITGFGAFHLQEGNITFSSEIISSLNAEYEGMDPIAEQKKQGVKNVVIADISLDEVFTEESEDTSSMAERTEEVQTEEGTTPITTEVTVTDESEGPTGHTGENSSEEKSEPANILEPEAENESTPEEYKPAPQQETEPEPPVIDNENEVLVTESTPSEELVSNTKEEEEQMPIKEAQEKKTNDKKRKFKWGYLILIFFVALLTAAVYYFRHEIRGFYHQWQESRVTTIVDTIESPQIDTIEDLTLEEDTLVATADEFTENSETKVEESTPSKTASNNSDNVPEITYESGKYYVIAGSFTSTSDAKRHIANRNLGKYNPCILRQNGSERLRVCIGIFTTESEANTLIAQTGAKYWVLK